MRPRISKRGSVPPLRQSVGPSVDRWFVDTETDGQSLIELRDRK